MIKEISKQKQINGAKKSAKIQKQRKQKRIEEYNLNPSLCKHCNSSLSYDKRYYKFCSKSCSASFNNLGVQRNITTGERAKKECLYCKSYTTNVKFCNTECQQNYFWGIRKKEIETTGETTGKVTAIRYLKETRGDICEICEVEDWNDKNLVMIMDHIDGNSFNNTILNLRLICPNCDSQTDTYKGRNKGNGRHYRRKRYAEGKSY